MKGVDLDAARAFAESTGAVFVHPYDDPLVVPVGGGGLIAGIAVAARALRPSIEVIGVESERFCAMAQRLAGLPVSTGTDTAAEGLAVQDVGALPRRVAREHVDEAIVVHEADIEQAVCWLADIEKTVVEGEGAGAAGLAAIARFPERFAGRRVGVPLTGGNTDMRVLSSVLLRGLAADGRLSRVAVPVADRVGTLARLTDAVARAGANVIEIGHDRLFTRESVRLASVERLREDGLAPALVGAPDS